jgi:hypothetical protein
LADQPFNAAVVNDRVWVASGHRSVTNGAAPYKKLDVSKPSLGKRANKISDWFSGILPFMHRADELDSGVLADVLLR